MLQVSFIKSLCILLNTQFLRQNTNPSPPPPAQVTIGTGNFTPQSSRYLLPSVSLNSLMGELGGETTKEPSCPSNACLCQGRDLLSGLHGGKCLYLAVIKWEVPGREGHSDSSWLVSALLTHNQERRKSPFISSMISRERMKASSARCGWRSFKSCCQQRKCFVVLSWSFFPILSCVMPFHRQYLLLEMRSLCPQLFLWLVWKEKSGLWEATSQANLIMNS